MGLIAKRPRGTADVLPGEASRWRKVEAKFSEHCALYGYGEIRTPVFEHAELFERAVGPSSDIVRKEMYTFEDKGGRRMTLRAEGTAPAVRAFLENKMNAAPQPVKLCYIAPVFRHERPQAGRLRQHHQLGIEAFGAAGPTADAEVIALGWTFLQKMGLGRQVLLLNSIGCPACRPAYREELLRYFSSKMAKLCPDCRERFELNPLRILDCKKGECREAAEGAPKIVDRLCGDCGSHFDRLRFYLSSLGIWYEIDSRLVRGLDYYTRTVFEIVHGELGSQSAICAGGRYDGLVEECGGPSVPGVGFGMGIERLLLALEAEGAPGFSEKAPPRQTVSCLVAVAESGPGQEDISPLRRAAWDVLFSLRRAGVSCDIDHLGRSLKAQMKYAEKTGTPFVVILGEDEFRSREASLRDMRTGRQERCPLERITQKLSAEMGLGGGG